MTLPSFLLFFFCGQLCNTESIFDPSFFTNTLWCTAFFFSRSKDFTQYLGLFWLLLFLIEKSISFFRAQSRFNALNKPSRYKEEMLSSRTSCAINLHMTDLPPERQHALHTQQNFSTMALHLDKSFDVNCRCTLVGANVCLCFIHNLSWNRHRCFIRHVFIDRAQRIITFTILWLLIM